MNTIDKTDDFPEGARGLCWGGFFLTIIWGIFNNVWISLLVLIPIVNIVMTFILLFKGRQWAWEKGKWRDVEHFNKVQKRWNIAGIAIAIVPIIIAVAVMLISNPFVEYQNKSKRSEAKIRLVALWGYMEMERADNGKYPLDWKHLMKKGGLQESEQSLYSIHTIETLAMLKEYCPDCVVTDTAFKFAAVGNLDDDPELDIVTMDEKENIVILSED